MLDLKHFSTKIVIETEKVSINDTDPQIAIVVLVNKVEAFLVFSNGTYQVDIEGTDYPLSEYNICAVNFFGSEEKEDRDHLLSKIFSGSVWYVKGDYFIDVEDNEIRVFPKKYVPVCPLLEDGE